MLILQDGSRVTNQPGSPTPLALGTVSHVGTDPAQCLTVVTPVSALTALTVWKVGCPGYLFCTVYSIYSCNQQDCGEIWNRDLSTMFQHVCRYNVSSICKWTMVNFSPFCIQPEPPTLLPSKIPQFMQMHHLAHFRAICINFRLYRLVFVCPHPQTQRVEPPDGLLT